jgi:metal-responsive CopG/Arc/MetJ family transcriptional regulator
MANVHKHKQRVLRGIDDDLAEDFDKAARNSGSDRSAVTRQLWEWYVGRPGAKLPERPDSGPAD